jgi:hypothetical protein
VAAKIRTAAAANPVFSSGKTPITYCGDEPKYETMAAIDPQIRKAPRDAVSLTGAFQRRSSAGPDVGCASQDLGAAQLGSANHIAQDARSVIVHTV